MRERQFSTSDLKCRIGFGTECPVAQVTPLKRTATAVDHFSMGALTSPFPAATLLGFSPAGLFSMTVFKTFAHVFRVVGTDR